MTGEGWLRAELRFEAPEDSVMTGTTVLLWREHEVRPAQEVGRAYWHLVDQSEGTPLVELDDIGADALALGEAADLVDGDLMLLVEHVQINDERLRGLELGLLLVRETVAGLVCGRGHLPVILQAQPDGWPDMAADQLAAAQLSLARHWRKLGFGSLPGTEPGDWIMSATAKQVTAWTVDRADLIDRFEQVWPGDEPPSALLRRRRGQVLNLFSEAGIEDVRVLGAVGRGADHHGDPVDFLIETSAELSGIDRLTLSRRLEALLGSEVGLTQLSDLGGHSRARALDDSMLL